ncbi:MAG TPA: hypothetical protein VGF55_29900 [Gemmataceae bacterium]
MFRSTRNIVLTILGSAALLGCCCVSCVNVRDEDERDANGNLVRDQNGHVIHHRHYFYHPWWVWGRSGYYGRPWWTTTSTYSPSYGRSGGVGRTGSGGSRSTSGATSRGGFGSTGHAAAGG